MQQRQHKRTIKFVAAAATATIAAAMLTVSVTTASAAPVSIAATNNDTWSPATLATVVVGDVVTFSNLSSHDATGTIIPATAAPIKSPANASTYAYTVSVAGVYKYVCTKHSGMNGTFTAAAAAGSTPVATTAGSTPVATTAGTTAAAPAGVTKTVTMTAGAISFAPQKLEINLGDTVAWKNNDTHNVISANIPAGAVAFTSPMLDGSAATFSYKPTKLGTYKYYCSLHSSGAADANATPQKMMTGEFTVVASGAAAAPAGGAAAGTTVAGATGSAPAGAQVSSIPVGGVQTGGGSTAAGVTNTGLITLGFGLLMAAFMTTVASRRVARQK